MGTPLTIFSLSCDLMGFIPSISTFVIGVRVIRVSFESPEMNFQSFFNTHESSTNEQLGYFYTDTGTNY